MSDIRLEIEVEVYSRKLIIPYIVEYEMDDISRDPDIEWIVPVLRDYKIDSDSKLRIINEGINSDYTEDDIVDLLNIELMEDYNE